MSKCNIHQPSDGWLVNKNSNNILKVSFTGFDINNDFLESISLEIKNDNDGIWKPTDVIITVSKPITKFYDYDFDVSKFVDGVYSIRAIASCGSDGGYTYSNELKGRINRNSIAPFGYQHRLMDSLETGRRSA